MLTQKIIGTEYKKIKYHGDVKFLIFECNNCGKSFSKMESYSKKQLKIHKNACCFCSPDCRNDYFNKILLAKTKAFNVKTVTAEVKVKPVLETPALPAKPVVVTALPEPPITQKEEKKSSFFGWLNKVLEG